MKNLIYAENKRIWKHPLTILTLVLAFLAAVFNVNNSTKQYLSEHTFNEEMNLYYLDAKKIDIEKALGGKLGKIQSEFYYYDILSFAEQLDLKGDEQENLSTLLREKIKQHLDTNEIKYSEDIKNKVTDTLDEVKIDLSYGEGWKNLNKNLSKFLYINLFLSIIFTANIMSTKNKEGDVYQSTFYGKNYLFKAKAILAAFWSLIFCLLSILALLILYIGLYGVEGAYNAIQNSPIMTLSLYKETYLSMFIKNGLLGLVTIETVVFLTIILSKKIKNFMQIFTSIILYYSLLILLDKIGSVIFNYKLLNFLSYKAMGFFYHYTHYDLYLFGDIVLKSIDAILLVKLIQLIAFGIFIFGFNTESRGKLKTRKKAN